MDIDAALTFARDHRNGVLVTLKADGRPQSSNIIHTVTDDGRVRISITADRAKYKNLVRDPRVSLHVSADDFWSYVGARGRCRAEPGGRRPRRRHRRRARRDVPGHAGRAPGLGRLPRRRWSPTTASC